MRTVGIICEFNPLHSGHAYLMAQLRQKGAEAIVCAMSGNFVQRGEPALVHKLARAEMAVDCGADLVLELPTPWAMATAETFAMGFSRVYTFGPTFRAENSNTKTHMAEFWMIEPEIAFCDLDELMDIEEDFLKSVVRTILERCPAELDVLANYNKTDLKG